MQWQIPWRRACFGSVLYFISPIYWTPDFCCCNKTWNTFKLIVNECGCTASIQHHSLQRGHISSLIHLKSSGCMTSLTFPKTATASWCHTHSEGNMSKYISSYFYLDSYQMKPTANKLCWKQTFPFWQSRKGQNKLFITLQFLHAGKTFLFRL